MSKDKISKAFNSEHDGTGLAAENQPKRILYLAETPFYELTCIEVLREAGYSVHVAGKDDGYSGVAVDCAMKNLRDPDQKFDLVVSSMYMACGRDNFGLAETDMGWQTGRVFAERLREEGIDVPVIIYELDTGLRDLPGYKRSQGTLTLSGGESVPVVRKEEQYKVLADKVHEMIGKSVPSAPKFEANPEDPSPNR